jgi:hypothetical protein
MFNGLVKAYLNSDYWFLRLNKRVKSLTLEMWYTLSVFFPFLVISMVITTMFVDAFQTNFSLMLIGLLTKTFSVDKA